MDVTIDELKALLNQPLALFACMLMASIGSALKQLKVAQWEGVEARCLEYLRHWPETLAVVISNILAFATLVATDTLNFASAVGIGYVANSAADLVTKGGRSATLRGGPP